MLKNYNIWKRTDKRNLSYFLLKTQKKQDPIIFFNLHMSRKIAFQISLLISPEPSSIAIAVLRDRII